MKLHYEILVALWKSLLPTVDLHLKFYIHSRISYEVIVGAAIFNKWTASLCAWSLCCFKILARTRLQMHVNIYGNGKWHQPLRSLKFCLWDCRLWYIVSFQLLVSVLCFACGMLNWITFGQRIIHSVNCLQAIAFGFHLPNYMVIIFFRKCWAQEFLENGSPHITWWSVGKPLLLVFEFLEMIVCTNLSMFNTKY